MNKNRVLNKLNFHIVIQACLFLVLLAADQISKQFVLNRLQDTEGITVIGGILDLHFLRNTGAAFGIFKNSLWLFYVIGIAAILILVILYLRIVFCIRGYIREESDIRIEIVRKMTGLNGIFAVLTAGAAGNLADRIFRGYVIDFLYLRFIDFPIFNIADICVTLSVISLIIFFIFFCKENDMIRLFGKAKNKRTRD